MDDPEPVPIGERDYIHGWADELVEQIEESLAKHAEFDRLYPEEEEAVSSR